MNNPLTTEKTSTKIKRLKRSFLLDHPGGATKERTTLFLEEVDAVLDTSVDADELRGQMRGITRTFELYDNPSEQIKNFDALCEELEKLVYHEVNQVQQ